MLGPGHRASPGPTVTGVTTSVMVVPLEVDEFGVVESERQFRVEDLLQLDDVAVGVAGVDRSEPRVSHLVDGRWGSVEGHAARRQTFVLGVDVDDVDTEVGVAVPRRIAHGVGRTRLRGLVLEQFEVGIARLQHHLASSRSGEPDHPIDDLAIAPLRGHDDLEAHHVGVEGSEAIEVGRRDGDMVDAADHRGELVERRCMCSRFPLVPFWRCSSRPSC